MLEASLSDQQFDSSSIPKRPRGDPYFRLRELATELADGLESRARACESLSERRRLAVLAAASSQISQCLSNVGVKL